jgi:hypothetical protein
VQLGAVVVWANPFRNRGGGGASGVPANRNEGFFKKVYMLQIFCGIFLNQYNRTWILHL